MFIHSRDTRPSATVFDARSLNGRQVPNHIDIELDETAVRNKDLNGIEIMDLAHRYSDAFTNAVAKDRFGMPSKEMSLQELISRFEEAQSIEEEISIEAEAEQSADMYNYIQESIQTTFTASSEGALRMRLSYTGHPGNKMDGALSEDIAPEIT